MAVSNQAGQNIDAEVNRATMARMLAVGAVLERVDDRFNDGAFASEQFVGQPHQARLHVAFGFGKQLNAAGVEQVLKQGLRNLAPVRKDFAKQGFESVGPRCAIVDVAGGEPDVEPCALVLDN